MQKASIKANQSTVSEKFIILKGNANTGKTTILNNVFQLLIEEVTKKYIEINDQNSTTLDKRIFVVLKKDSKCVIICTGGDDAQTITDNINYFKQQEHVAIKNYNCKKNNLYKCV